MYNKRELVSETSCRYVVEVMRYFWTRLSFSVRGLYVILVVNLVHGTLYLVRFPRSNYNICSFVERAHLEIMQGPHIESLSSYGRCPGKFVKPEASQKCMKTRLLDHIP